MLEQRGPTPLLIALFVLNLAGVSGTVLLRFFVLERERERAKSERLLLNVLPASVAARLRDDEGTIADGFDEVTVFSPTSWTLLEGRLIG